MGGSRGKHSQAITARSLDLIIPTAETVFEVEVGGKEHRTTLAKAMEWANRRANRA